MPTSPLNPGHIRNVLGSEEAGYQPGGGQLSQYCQACRVLNWRPFRLPPILEGTIRDRNRLVAIARRKYHSASCINCMLHPNQPRRNAFQSRFVDGPLAWRLFLILRAISPQVCFPIPDQQSLLVDWVCWFVTDEDCATDIYPGAPGTRHDRVMRRIGVQHNVYCHSTNKVLTPRSVSKTRSSMLRPVGFVVTQEFGLVVTSAATLSRTILR
ncbi:hypothetical protein M408DRAFT_105702 [Serendipita vermifera MAFF 305830]|uniref:Uncharacterized protein n=1 Tax=Serendipita vermifera MAFF 305830 TaxID=933852 RepID=A0A0C2WU48_SERVB|nr:hypothetical protein M408DRAFT_105702 [Serendipita vermifera MAFF 305830]